MLARSIHDQRSHVELITIYEICRILGASLDIDRTFRDALNVLAAHLGLDRAMIVVPVPDDASTESSARPTLPVTNTLSGME